MNKFLNGWRGYVLLALFLTSFELAAGFSKDLPIVVRIIMVVFFGGLSLVALIQANRLKEKELNVDGYVIKKGKHRSYMGIFRNGPVLDFEFTFTEQHRYRHLVDSDHWNKLYGLTSFFIHKNSARFAWRETEDGDFEIGAYMYVNGKRLVISLITIKAGEKVNLVLIISKSSWTFQALTNKEFTAYPKYGVKKTFGWLTHPYFGGTPTAPKEFNFKFIK